MKKIFAFILASIMVLSLVPASAFAAVTNCPKTHTTAVCDALGISYSQIGNPVAPSCISAGYTLYACDECGEEFVGNFTEKAGHNYQPDPKRVTENVKADCTTKTNGLTYVVCSVCGDKNIDKNGVQQPIEVSWNHKSVHKLVSVAGSGIGCEARYRCSLCGIEGYLNEKGELDEKAWHTWNFVKVIEEPVWKDGKGTNGLAQYKCSVCGDTKDVEIWATCDCINKLELVCEAVEPTCATAGSIVLYQCYDCAKYYTIDENGEYDLLTLDEDHEDYDEEDDYNGDGVIDELDAVREIAHEIDPEINPVYDGCSVTYVCKICETAYTEAAHTWVKYGQYGYATCASSVVTLYKCSVCYEEYADVSETLNHETVEFTIPATCNTKGYKGLYCKDCGVDVIPDNPVYGKDYFVVTELVGETEEEAAEVDVIYPVVYYTELKPDGTSHVPAEKVYVDDDNDSSTPSKDDDGVEGEDAYTWYTRAEYLESRVCNSGTVYKVWECMYGCLSYGVVPERVTKNPSHVYRDYGVIVNSSTSSTNWKPKFASTVVAGKSSEVSMAKSTKNILQECVICGTVSSKSKTSFSTTKVYIFDTVEKAYEYHGILLRYVYDGEGAKANLIDKVWDVDADYVTANARTFTITTEADNNNCTSAGYIKFKCKGNGGVTCLTTGDFYAKADAGNHVADISKGWVKEKAATCTKTGTKGYWTCELCGAKFRYKGYSFHQYDADNGMVDRGMGQEVLTSLTINKHGSTLVEVPVGTCNAVTAYKCMGTDADGDLCGALFTDATASTAFNANTDTHDWVYAKGYEGKPATCNANGTIQIRWCAECKILEFNALYAVANGKVKPVTINTFTHDLELSSDVAEYVVSLDPVVRKFKLTADATVATDITTLQTSSTIAKFDHYAPVAGIEYDVYSEEAEGYVTDVFAVNEYMVLALDSYTDDVTVGDHTEVSYKRHMCAACGYEYLTDYIPATGGHMNADGEILTTECDNAAITDRVCVVCKKTIAIDHVESEIVVVKANCSTVGYEYWYCLTPGCGHRSVTGALEIDPDVHVLVDYGIENNYAHNGQEFTKCALCNEVIDDPKEIDAPKVAGVEISLYTDFDSYMPGSIVNVTVSLESLLGVDVWAARFGVKYDPEVYTFIGATNVAGEFNTANSMFLANGVMINDYTANVSIAEKVEAGYVSVLAQAEEDLFIKGSYDLVTLQFKVIATEIITEDHPFASVYGLTDSSFTVMEETIANPVYVGYNPRSGMYEYDAVTTPYPIEVRNEKGKLVKSMYNPQNPNEIGENSVAPVLQTYLDLDFDGQLTLADAKAIYAIIVDPEAEYNILADADGDGYVAPADLKILYDIFTGATTIEDVLGAKEAEEVVLKKLPERKIVTEGTTVIYDSYCDFDFNGVISGVAEESCLTGRNSYKTMWASLGYDVSNID